MPDEPERTTDERLRDCTRRLAAIREALAALGKETERVNTEYKMEVARQRRELGLK